MNIVKSIGAILAGFIVGGALSVITDSILEALKIFPPPDQGFFIPWMITLAIVYRSFYNVFGCYVTAALAPARPMLHVMIIGVIGLILTVVGTIVNADKGPLWYGLTLAISSVPCAWLGGTLYVRKRTARSTAAA